MKKKNPNKGTPRCTELLDECIEFITTTTEQDNVFQQILEIREVYHFNAGLRKQGKNNA